MSQPPFEPLGLPPGAPAAPEPPPEGPEPPPREPFWAYSDLAVFLGLLIASALAGLGIVTLIFNVFPIQLQAKVAEALIAQCLIYLLAFGALAVMFRVQYGRPFWRSLGWIPFRLPGLVV